MNTIKRKLPFVCFAGLMILLLSVGGCGGSGSSKEAPDFTLMDLSDNEISLKEHRGKVVLIDFFATWCPPCQYSIPELIKMQNEYGEKGLVILAISLDDPAKTNKRFLRAFKEKFRMNFTVLRGTERVVRDYFGSGEVGLPTSFLVNREGMIAGKHVGYAPEAIKDSIKKLI
jgi:peroxiredoxin